MLWTKRHSNPDIHLILHEFMIKWQNQIFTKRTPSSLGVKLEQYPSIEDTRYIRKNWFASGSVQYEKILMAKWPQKVSLEGNWESSRNWPCLKTCKTQIRLLFTILQLCWPPWKSINFRASRPQKNRWKNESPTNVCKKATNNATWHDHMPKSLPKGFQKGDPRATHEPLFSCLLGPWAALGAKMAPRSPQRAPGTTPGLMF